MVKHTMTEGEMLEDEIEAPDPVNVPWLYRWTNITHYYGDYVRELLICGAVLMLIAAPFYVDDLNTELPFLVIGTLIIVGVAALTNPRKRGIMSLDAVTAGVAFVLFQIWALRGYQDEPVVNFVLREAIAIVFLFAFYFSTKTLRNMMLNTIGKPDRPDEFLTDETPNTRTKDTGTNFKQQARHALDDLNDHEKLDFND